RRFRCAALCPVRARLGPFAMSGFPPLLGGMADVEQRISSRYLRRRLPQRAIRNDGGSLTYRIEASAGFWGKRDGWGFSMGLSPRWVGWQRTRLLKWGGRGRRPR